MLCPKSTKTKLAHSHTNAASLQREVEEAALEESFPYLLGLLAMIKCSICSYQCDNWYVSNWRLACHINFCLGRCSLELAQRPLRVALAWHLARRSTPLGVTKALYGQLGRRDWLWAHKATKAKKLFTLLDLCVSSLRRGHANLLCIVPILTDDPRRESELQGGIVCSDRGFLELITARRHGMRQPLH